MLQKQFGNDLVVIRKSKVTLTLNKPAYAAMCTLDLNKVIMYELYYSYINNKYGNNLRLLFTETDSLMYEVKTEDVHQDFSMDKKMFHFSNYSDNKKYYDESNKLVVDKMKDETSGVTIKDFFGLKLKMYSFYL